MAGAARGLVAAGMLVYGVAVAAVALLALPALEDAGCAGVDLSPLPLSRGIGTLGPGDPLADPAVLLFVLTAGLFMPLGFFVRVLWSRGVLVSLGLGAAFALLIELSQLAGSQPCGAVAHVVAGGAGALLGSVASLALPRRWRVRSAVVAQPPATVTRLRRGLAMACDWVSVYLTGFVLSAPVAAVLYASGGSGAVEAAGVPLDAVATYSAMAVTAAVALGTGRTIGDRILQLEYRGGSLPPFVARLVRYVCGIGGYQILTAPTEGANPVSLAFVLVSIVLVFTTAQGRGLPGLATRRELFDVREPRAAEAVDSR
ncbi:VanZ family protein [Microbacterium sp. SS28]|uniref:VanZ family protein n=1 Tax=Microbacterium sp. SS28 TaxID=2919948 RepID=UPI001FAB11EB|nr:VanZ family protein [Microbacterium sp. SS28]